MIDGRYRDLKAFHQQKYKLCQLTISYNTSHHAYNHIIINYLIYDNYQLEFFRRKTKI